MHIISIFVMLQNTIIYSIISLNIHNYLLFYSALNFLIQIIITYIVIDCRPIYSLWLNSYKMFVLLARISLLNYYYIIKFLYRLSV